MKKILLATAIATLFSANAYAAPFSWINGKVSSFTAQLPMFTVAIVNNKGVRFCDPNTGADYPVAANNLFYDMLKSSFDRNQNVQVGVNDFGQDPQSGSAKLCINRVILSH